MKIDVEKLKEKNNQNSRVIEPYLNKIFDVEYGNFVLCHGGKGTGKSFFLTYLSRMLNKLGWHVFTNIKFQRRREGDLPLYNRKAWIEDYPDGVEFVDNIADMIYNWSLIKIKNPDQKFILVMDELESFVMNIRATGKESEILRVFLNQNRKLDMVVIGMVHKMKRLPNAVKEWAEYLFYKSSSITGEYNKIYGTNYSVQKQAFLFNIKDGMIYCENLGGWIDIGSSKFKVKHLSLNDACDWERCERTSWTKEPENCKVGDCVYVSKSPSTFTLGTIGKYTVKEWWEPFKNIFSSINVELPYKIKFFFENIDDELSDLDEEDLKYSFDCFSKSQLAKFLGEHTDQTYSYWAGVYGITRQSVSGSEITEEEEKWLLKNLLKHD